MDKIRKIKELLENEFEYQGEDKNLIQAIHLLEEVEQNFNEFSDTLEILGRKFRNRKRFY